MTAYPFTEQEGRRLGITRKTTDIVARIPIAEMPPEGPMLPVCPALRDDEIECRNDSHEVRDRRITYRICPLARYRADRRRLSAQLALCGYPANVDEIERPIAPALWDLLDAQRNVAGLDRLTAAISDIIQRGPRANGHAAFVGTVGTAKTHALLLLFFWARYAGVSAAWLTSTALRELAQELRAFDEERQAAAQLIFRSWKRYQLIVFDDLGDQLSEIRAREPGSTAVAALMQDLLNGSEARMFWSSNLGAKDSNELRAHPDLGPRVTDRLYADHRGEPCLKVTLSGPSQRHHQARTQRREKRCDA